MQWEVPPDWISAHQAALTAYRLTQISVEDFEDKDRAAQRERDHAFLTVKLREAWEACRKVATGGRHMPVDTLYLLQREEVRNCLGAGLKDIADTAATEYARVTTPREDLPSLAESAKLVTYQILYSDARARAVIDTADAFLRGADTWSRLTEGQQTSVRLALRCLRTAQNPMLKLVHAVEAMTFAILPPLPGWYAVRNALYDSIFAWPLLVLGAGEGALAPATISVPVAVDLDFTPGWRGGISYKLDSGRSRAKLLLSLEGQEEAELAQSAARVTDWEASLQRAVKCGKDLWRSKNGEKGNYRDMLADAGVHVDFSIASMISRFINEELNFEEESAEVYFSQVVLAKATARHAGITAAVTGTIGKQREHALPQAEADKGNLGAKPQMTTVLDWGFDPAAWLKQKLQFSYLSGKYDRKVLPRADRKKVETLVAEAAAEAEAEDDDGDQSMEFVRGIETTYCKHLSDVADCVQIGGWRPFTYVRAADAGHLMHNDTEELPKVNSEEVAKTLTLLAKNNSAVLDWPSDLRPLALLAALRFLNYERRDSLPYMPPMFSWTFVRAVPYEQDERFFNTLWRAVSSSREDFRRFRLATKPFEAAQLLAEQLNNFVPSHFARNTQTPALLVVLDSDELTDTAEPDGIAALRPHYGPAVFKALSKMHLAPVPDGRHRQVLGRTRIIRIPRAGELGRKTWLHMDNIPAKRLELLSRLTTFQHGFSPTMAYRLCEDLYDDAQAMRRDLRLLDKVHSALSTGGGTFRVRPLKNEHHLPEPAIERATLHLKAGYAFAPYLGPSSGPPQNLADAMAAERIREAAHHFETAAQLANRKGLYKVTREARTAHERLTRFFDVPTWSAVSLLMSNRQNTPSGEAYLLARELVRDHEDAEKRISMRGLTTAARAAENRWIGYRKGGAAAATQTDKSIADECKLREEIVGYFELAVKRASAATVGTDPLKLHALTHYCGFLRRWKVGSSETLAEFERQLLEVLRKGVRHRYVRGEWFEMMGEAEPDHQKALEFYRMGFECSPNWPQVLLLLIGTHRLIGKLPASIWDHLCGLTPEQIGHLKRSCHARYGERLGGAAKERWNSGADSVHSLLQTMERGQRPNNLARDGVAPLPPRRNSNGGGGLSVGFDRTNKDGESHRPHHGHGQGLKPWSKRGRKHGRPIIAPSMDPSRDGT